VIDWLTLRLDGSLLPPKVRATFRERQDRIIKINPDGETVWETWSRESIRSDSHQITVRLTDLLEITGSPARVMQEDNVFGSSDIVECFNAVINFVGKQLNVTLPNDPNIWRVTRVDYTENYNLESLSEVKQALNYLRHAEGGRYQVRTTAETVYWSPTSRLRSGKAYAKGPHLDYMKKKGLLDIDDAKIAAAQSLLRLELKIGSQYWRERSEKQWFNYTENDFIRIHNDYFGQFIGNVEIMETDNLLEILQSISTTNGQALASFRTWCLVKSVGIEETRKTMPKSTWYRHKKLLNQAGVSWADFQEQKIVPFRRKAIVLDKPVRSWEEVI
jgi:II/X family phage/plasmid replication protein